MKLIIHRGAEEIGGNCIELQSGSSRILLDYGAPLLKRGEKKPKDNSKFILNNIEGLYENSEKPINGLLISHTHQDHFGMLFEKPVNPRIPVYMSGLTEDIIRMTGKMLPGSKELKANVRHFKKEKPFKIGDFKIKAYLMDHSAVESFAFIIEAEGKKVFYSGDFREHGHKKGAFKRFINQGHGKIDLALIEGTMLGRENKEEKTEKDIFIEIKRHVEKSKGPVFVLCSGQNIDLITSLAGIADMTKRYLLIDAYVAMFLELIKKHLPKAKIPSCEKNYLKILGLGITKKVEKLGYDDEFKHIRSKLVGKNWLKENYKKCIVPIRASSGSWFNLFPDIKDSLYIYSLWEGYLEDKQFMKITDFFKKRGIEKKDIHTTGHAYISTLKKLIDKIKPVQVIPIHTEHPENFKEKFGVTIKRLLNGEEYDF